MEIQEMPLWNDVSQWQGEIKWAKLRESPLKPEGVYVRAGLSIYEDAQFDRNWAKVRDHGYWRTHYWAFWPDVNPVEQLNAWYTVAPEIDLLPRVMDLEKENGVPLGEIAGMIVWWSNEITDRDGVRPWIYGRKSQLDRFLTPHVSADFLNKHYYIIADYGNHRDREEDILRIPDKVDPSRVILHQTADQMKPDPLGVTEDGAFLDRNRWRLGDVDQMEDWLAERYSGVVVPEDPEPEPEPTLESRVAKLEKDTRENRDGIQMLDESVAGNIALLEDDFRTHSTRQRLRREMVDRRLTQLQHAVDRLEGDAGRPWWTKIFG